MENNFKNSLKEKVNITPQQRKVQLDEKYKLLKSKEMSNFTNIILASFGKEIEEKYPTIKYDLKERDKSLDSKNKKLNKKLFEDKTPPMEVELYDTIGFRLVVTEIPYEFKTGDPEFDRNFESMLLERANAEEAYNEQNAVYEEFTERFCNEKEDSIELYKFAEQEAKKNLKNVYDTWQLKIDECELVLSDYLIKFLSENSMTAKKFNLSNIPGRLKTHRKENGYYATHNGIEVSDKNSPYYGWMAELQGKSSRREEMCHTGSSAHTNRPGKKRILPPLLESCNKKDYRTKISNAVSSYRIYLGNGKVRKCSLLENTIHYYKDNLSRSPSYFKKMVTDQELLPSRGEEFTL